MPSGRTGVCTMGSTEGAAGTVVLDEADTADTDMTGTIETAAANLAPQRARTVFVIALGDEMKAEWESARVPQALRRLSEAARPYAPHDGKVSVIRYATSVLVEENVSLDEFERDGILERPDCGSGANLTAAIDVALGMRQGDERLHIYVVSDCKVSDAELERAKRAIQHAQNVVVMLIRVSTDADGMDAAYELDEMAAGHDDKVELVHYNDGRGRDVGANLPGHVRNRMEVVLARYYTRPTAA